MGRLRSSWQIHDQSLLTFLVTLVAFLCSCGKPPSSGATKPEVRFGIALNDVRKAKGIPQLDTSWKLESATPDTLKWSSPKRTPLGVAAYFGKITEFSGDVVVWEEDWYSDGQTYDWIDPDQPTETRNCSIIIRFDFRKSKSGSDPWTFCYEAGRGFKPITEQEAEDKLKVAGLKRRNY